MLGNLYSCSSVGISWGAMKTRVCLGLGMSLRQEDEPLECLEVTLKEEGEGSFHLTAQSCLWNLGHGSPGSCLSSFPSLAHGQVSDNWFTTQTQGKADLTELLSAYRLPTLFLLLFLPWKLGKLNRL